MPERPPFPAAVALLLCIGWWATALVAGATGLDRAVGRSAGVALWLLGVVVLVGFLVARGRWSQRLAVGISLLPVAVAPFLESSWVLWGGVAVAALSGVLALAPPTAEWIRPGRAMDAPPDAAIVLMVLLLAWPLLAAPLVAGGSAWAYLSWSGPLLAFWYGRARVSALWGVRVGAVALPVLAAVGGEWWGWIAGAAIAGATSWWAWRDGARLAVVPLVARPASGVCPTPNLDTVVRGR